jgi:hypothetical protein
MKRAVSFGGIGASLSDSACTPHSAAESGNGDTGRRRFSERRTRRRQSMGSRASSSVRRGVQSRADLVAVILLCSLARGAAPANGHGVPEVKQ